jgi:DNA-binding phage protein
MSKKKIKLPESPEFDAAEHLPDDKAIAQYLAVVLEENDPSALVCPSSPDRTRRCSG